jgi:CRISPR-associated protein Cas1
MISLPDFKEKQLLFVRSEWGKPSRLSFHNDNIVFEQEHKVVNRVSAHKAFAVFIAGDLSLTTNFIKQAKEFGISVLFLKNNFEIYGGLNTEAEGHYLLRMKQYAMPEMEQFAMAKKLVANKIQNQIAVLKEREEGVAKKMLGKIEENVLKNIDEVKTETELLGIEGRFSKEYFTRYFGKVGWRRRAPRTKEDVNNFLMDMGYTYLFNFCDSILRLFGFDTYKGFYHKLFFQRRSLACDVMEVFRPIIDREILKMHNLGILDIADFEAHQGEYVLPFKYWSKYSSVFLNALMKNKEDIFEFIQQYYRHQMKPEKYDFPNYQIKIS